MLANLVIYQMYPGYKSKPICPLLLWKTVSKLFRVPRRTKLNDLSQSSFALFIYNSIPSVPLVMNSLGFFFFNFHTESDISQMSLIFRKLFLTPAVLDKLQFMTLRLWDSQVSSCYYWDLGLNTLQWTAGRQVCWAAPVVRARGSAS